MNKKIKDFIVKEIINAVIKSKDLVNVKGFNNWTQNSEFQLKLVNEFCEIPVEDINQVKQLVEAKVMSMKFPDDPSGFYVFIRKQRDDYYIIINVDDEDDFYNLELKEEFDEAECRTLEFSKVIDDVKVTIALIDYTMEPKW
jgi:hypothetical protein